MKKNIILKVIAFAIGLSGCSEQTDGNESTNPNQYQSAIDLNYRDAMLEKIQNNAYVVFVGQISQIIDDNSASIETKYTSITDQVRTPHSWQGFGGEILSTVETKNVTLFAGYTGDKVTLLFATKPQLLVGDKVRIFGRYSGTAQQTLVSGEVITVPQFEVDYYKVFNGGTYDSVGTKMNGEFTEKDGKFTFLTFDEIKKAEEQEKKKEAEAKIQAELNIQNGSNSEVQESSQGETQSDEKVIDVGTVTGLDPNGDGFLSIRDVVPQNENSKEIGRLHNGDTVNIVGKQGHWYKIKLKDSNGYGWCHGNWIKINSHKQPSNSKQNTTSNNNKIDSRKVYAYKLMTGNNISNLDDIVVKANDKGIKIYCLSDMSMCKTEAEVTGNSYGNKK